MKRFNTLIMQAVHDGWSDLHITGGQPVVCRKDGQIRALEGAGYTHREMDSLVRGMLNQRRLDILKRRWSVDFALTVNNVRTRINVFTTSRGLSLAVRLLAGRIPTLDSLNLHPSLSQFTRLKSGLILVCGATGSGKTTTIASMIDEINRNRPAHIITLEDPIEYRFRSKKSFVEQRELGSHFPSFERGLLDVLREDPDVVMVGELREAETIRLSLSAAESGHLVIASLHSSNPEEALYRICNSFPLEAQELVRHQLSTTLNCIIVQQLIPYRNLTFRVPLLSILMGTAPVRMMIRESKFSQFSSVMEMNRQDGMYTMEAYRTEWLDRQTRFVSPVNNLLPSEDEAGEAEYVTPLVDNGLGLTHYPSQRPQPDTQSGKPAFDGDGGGYTITDHASLEEVLREFGD